MSAERAREFWARYDVPVEHDTAIKPRRAGLLRGSGGDGHASDTVVHLHLKESFTDGRVSRDADAYLCESGSVADPNGREERHLGDGEHFTPRVTCETCLDRMQRWRSADGEAADTDSATDTNREHQTPGGYHFSVSSAGHSCGVCGDAATAYLHGLGLRCGDCHAGAPASRRDTPGGGAL